jgi:hypothetical protein
MNRILVLGVAVFMALVGISILGTSTDAVLAGHGCCGCCGGCYGCNGCYGNGCYGCSGCYGCHGCHGYNQGPAPVAPPPASARRAMPSTTVAAPATDRSHMRSPAGFRQVSFRR